MSATQLLQSPLWVGQSVFADPAYGATAVLNSSSVALHADLTMSWVQAYGASFSKCSKAHVRHFSAPALSASGQNSLVRAGSQRNDGDADNVAVARRKSMEG